MLSRRLALNRVCCLHHRGLGERGDVEKVSGEVVYLAGSVAVGAHAVKHSDGVIDGLTIFNRLPHHHRTGVAIGGKAGIGQNGKQG